MSLEHFWPGPLTLLLATRSGVDIFEACVEAARLADDLQIPIGFVHNDRFLLAKPGDSHFDLLATWEAKACSFIPGSYGARPPAPPAAGGSSEPGGDR